MKYKVGDKVRVVWVCDSCDTIRVGDVLEVTHLFPDGNPSPHYGVRLPSGGCWWVDDDEIELYEEPKMSKYTTEPIDYTGCHPVIAEHLKRGEAILCRVGICGIQVMIIGYDASDTYKYRSPDNGWMEAEPVVNKKKVLISPEKAVVKLIENGATVQDCERFIARFRDYEANKKTDKEFLEDYADYLFEEVDD